MLKRNKSAGDTVKVTFALPQDVPAGAVSVLGDFNGWDEHSHPLKKRSNGTRSVKVAVAPGTSYAFRYLAEGGVWFDDPEQDARDLGNGVVAG